MPSGPNTLAMRPPMGALRTRAASGLEASWRLSLAPPRAGCRNSAIAILIKPSVTGSKTPVGAGTQRHTHTGRAHSRKRDENTDTDRESHDQTDPHTIVLSL